MILIGGFTAFSLAIALLDPGFAGVLGALTIPGTFLIQSFHIGAVFVPLFLGVHALLAVRRPFPQTAFLLTNFSVLPFLTASTAIRLLAGPPGGDAPGTSWLVATFSRSGAVILLTLTTALAVLFVLQRIQRARNAAIAEDTVANDTHGGDEATDDDTLAGRTRRVSALLSAPESEPGWNGAGVPAAGDHAGAATKSAAADEVGELEELEDAEEPEIILGDWEAVEPPANRARAAGAVDASVDEDDDDITFTGEELARAPRGLGAGADYDVPINGVLRHYEEYGYWEIDEETRRASEVLRVTLEEFNIQAEVTGIRKGPVITMFEILPAPGVKLAKITNLADNIALRLAASSVRIVAPIPGKHAVGIEIPNKQRHIVSFAELIQEDDFYTAKRQIPLAIGKDIPGDAQIVDLTKTPHLLIAGATGSGKSVCVNSIICSILYRRSPAEVRLMLIDPKIVELKFYNDIPHLLTPVITDPKRAFQALQYCIYEMERRYSLLDAVGVRDISAYNEKIHRRNLAMEHLPYIVVIVDEFADLMATSGKELEQTVARLAAMSRAVGIHLVLATQRPSTDVITGLIKANIPSRVAFMVSSKVDSRIIIDAVGAEKLLGQGDMLLTSSWDPFPKRIQGAFLADDEVEAVVEQVKEYGEPDYIDDEIFVDDEDDPEMQQELEDPLLEKAIDIVVSANKASASYLQRRLKVGYNRAARMVEEMERIGIVGPQQGSKPRDIIGRHEA
ncbi:MAG: DNA translocase FtsK [Spirochaetes bacterium]|nr:DNA translocase FtsK [Spirochaetota bacterium]